MRNSAKNIEHRYCFMIPQQKHIDFSNSIVDNASHMVSMILDGTELRAARSRLGLSQAKLAEITGVSQANLSAFELGKSSLPHLEIDRVNDVLSKGDEVLRVVTRKKRYRQHEFGSPLRDDSRSQQAKKTQENTRYVELLKTLDQQRNHYSKNAPTALSLFSGCGGFSTGFAWAGFKILGFLEINPDFRSIYRENFPNTVELGADITQVSQAQIQGWKNTLGQIEVIIGGPPCQGFSLSGKRQSDDSRNTLFEHYLRVVEVIRPKFAILENVRLLTSMKFPDGSLVMDAMRNGFHKIGYSVQPFEVNAKQYGVPQHRDRVLFMAVREDQKVEPSIPEPTHSQHSSLFSGGLPYRTFGDACSDLEFLESGQKSKKDVLHEAVDHPRHVIEWLWDVPQGASAHDNADPAMRPPSGYNTTYKRQVWAEPASTVQTTFGMVSGCRNVHPIATRALSVREAARIQSFPDTYKFSGTLGAVRTSIGNAVPPLLAYHFGCHIKDKLG
jgi:DNA (cytosine-5)-methyltransferase 1